MKTEEKGISAPVILAIAVTAAAVITVVIVAIIVQGGAPGGMPIYAGSEEWDIPTEFMAGLENIAHSGASIKGYTVSGVSVQELLNWYEGQMTDWELIYEQPATSSGGLTMGILLYRKGDAGCGIMAVSGGSLPGTCYILAAGPWSAFGGGPPQPTTTPTIITPTTTPTTTSATHTTTPTTTTTTTPTTTLPVCPGSQMWDIPEEYEAMLENMISGGMSYSAYTIIGMGPQEVLNWYKEHMSGWELIDEQPAAPTDGLTMGYLIYRKGTDGGGVLVMSGADLPGTCYILIVGPWSAFEESRPQPLIAIISIDYATSGSTKLAIQHLGGDSISDAFCGTSNHNITADNWMNLEVRINGSSIATTGGKTKFNDVLIGASTYDFTVGDILLLEEIAPLESGDVVMVIYRPTSQLLLSYSVL
jgi:hypothetical protein